MDSFLKSVFVRAGKHTSVHDVHPHTTHTQLCELVHLILFCNYIFIPQSNNLIPEPNPFHKTKKNLLRTIPSGGGIYTCCLPTPMTLASGGSPMFPLVVHQPASPSIWPAVQSLRRGLSTNPGATMWCVCGCSWRDDVCRVCGCYRGGIVVMDVFWRRLCVSMIWGREICLFWAGQGCDEWGGEVSLQSC